jgi:hypothetical protein
MAVIAGARNIHHNQIANEDLENLGLQTCAAGEDLLQDANEDVAEGRCRCDHLT